MNRLPRLALLAALVVLPLGLAGCGVRGGLEPPPRAAGMAQGGAESRGVDGWTGSERGTGTSALEPAPGTTDAAVTEAPAASRRSGLDWLIN